MEQLESLIAKELNKFVGGKVVPTMVKAVPPEIEGDYSLPTFPFAKKAGKDPKTFASELAGKINSKKGKLFRNAVPKDGFVNLFLDQASIASEVLKEIRVCGPCYGSGPVQKTKIILEHTSANPDAPMHVGHLRNSLIGDAVARILRFAGYPVEVQFYVNDMGGQLALLALRLSGMDYEKAFKEDWDKAGDKAKADYWIGKEYVAANKQLKKDAALENEAKALQIQYENGNKDVKKVMDFIVTTCLEGFNQTFADYGIGVDHYVRESDFVFDGSVKKLIKSLEKSKNWSKKNDVYCLDLEDDFNIEKELVLMRSDGTTLYTTRDLAYHKWKLSKGDCVNVIANEQTLPQKQLRAGLTILGVKDADKRVRHLSYELVSIPGMAMSSREGKFISADQVLAEGVRRAAAEIKSRKLELPEGEKEHIANAVGLGAIKYNILKVGPLKHLVFKWEEALNFEGDSAPYLQYAHARALRILENAGTLPKADKLDYSKVEFSDPERELLIQLTRFGRVVEDAAASLKPNLVANYAYDLAESFNKFYYKCPVIESAAEQKKFRALLVSCVRQVLANALDLIGVEPLERM